MKSGGRDSARVWWVSYFRLNQNGSTLRLASSFEIGAGSTTGSEPATGVSSVGSVVAGRGRTVGVVGAGAGGLASGVAELRAPVAAAPALKTGSGAESALGVRVASGSALAPGSAAASELGSIRGGATALAEEGIARPRPAQRQAAQPARSHLRSFGFHAWRRRRSESVAGGVW